MWWAIWCAAAVAGAVAAPASDALAPLAALELPQMDALTPDDESLGFAAQARRYAAPAPLVYLLADLTRDSQVSGTRVRRDFSVNPAVDLLTEAYTDKSRREHLTRANRELLKCIGKRDSWISSEDCFKKIFGK